MRFLTKRFIKKFYSHFIYISGGKYWKDIGNSPQLQVTRHPYDFLHTRSQFRVQLGVEIAEFSRTDGTNVCLSKFVCIYWTQKHVIFITLPLGHN